MLLMRGQRIYIDIYWVVKHKYLNFDDNVATVVPGRR